MPRIQRTILGSSVLPFRMVFLMWLTFAIGYLTRIDFSFLGILPRDFRGLIGIFTGPLIHAGYLHLLSNTVPLLFTGAMLFFYYPRIAKKVFVYCYFVTDILVWLFARGGHVHIGASGLIYGIAFFLMFFGIFRRDISSLIISIVVILFYGTLFYGILPTDPRISFESHLFGAVVGIGCAYRYRRTRVE